jgi:hypothetical protein
MNIDDFPLGLQASAAIAGLSAAEREELDAAFALTIADPASFTRTEPVTVTFKFEQGYRTATIYAVRAGRFVLAIGVWQNGRVFINDVAVIPYEELEDIVPSTAEGPVAHS